MSVGITWHDLKWRASMRVISNLSKFHTAGLLSVILLKICPAYVSRIWNRGIATDDLVQSIYCPCALALASYVPLLAMLGSRQASFRASNRTDVYNELWGLTNVITTFIGVAIFSNVVCRIKLSNYHIVFMLSVSMLYQLRVRRQRIDVMRALDRENITAPHMKTMLSLSIFHVIISMVITILLSVGMKLIAFLWALFSSTPVMECHFARLVNVMIAFVPGIREYRRNFYGLESTTVLLSAVWVITLTECYYELLNSQLSHMDQALSNSVEQFPSHGTLEYEDELILSRAFTHYSMGVSMTLNPVNNRFEPTGNAMHINFPDDRRRCPMVPFIKIPNTSTYTMEGKRQRYQVDALIYRMLVDTRGQMFSSYVEAFMECMVEAESHVIALGSKRESMGNLRIDLNPEANGCASCGGWIDFIFGGWLGGAPKVPYKAADSLVLAAIYMRGMASWLSIANMLGYDNAQVQQVAKEFVAQCVSLSKAIATIRRYSMPTHFSNTLDVITNVINIALKQMSVYADAMLYSTFDTDFDTFRLLEKIYKPMVQSTFA
ncbi:ABC transporter permease [Babesia ovis]|uniref:ABC transporter permease n=1 Tax=Babesia ovis TaxID=5869 RepID=A0A9W5WUM9_BABOV|nr:ABC transporter permease [Babesia ovis]